jgi:hypothetical protein
MTASMSITTVILRVYYRNAVVIYRIVYNPTASTVILWINYIYSMVIYGIYSPMYILQVCYSDLWEIQTYGSLQVSWEISEFADGLRMLLDYIMVGSRTLTTETQLRENMSHLQ